MMDNGFASLFNNQVNIDLILNHVYPCQHLGWFIPVNIWTDFPAGFHLRHHSHERWSVQGTKCQHLRQKYQCWLGWELSILCIHSFVFDYLGHWSCCHCFRYGIDRVPPFPTRKKLFWFAHLIVSPTLPLIVFHSRVSLIPPVQCEYHQSSLWWQFFLH